MTKDEIKKALKTCSVDSCTDCPYDNKGLYCCGKLKRDALDLITEQENEIELLKKENAYLLKACDEQFTFDTTENKKYSIFNSVRKEFADKIKVLIFQKDNPYAVPFEEVVNANGFCGYFDELLKEYEK